MLFESGTQVVHPQHGVGQIINVETKQFGSGTKRLYYEVAVAKSTIWVPADGTVAGLRRLTSKEELQQYGKVLKSKPAPVNKDHRQRRVELANRLKLGTFQAKCEVVRDLVGLGWVRSLDQPDASLLRVTRDGLCHEWAVVAGIPFVEALREVEALLQEAKLLFKN